jgi:hypothetical protein
MTNTEDLLIMAFKICLHIILRLVLSGIDTEQLEQDIGHLYNEHVLYPISRGLFRGHLSVQAPIFSYIRMLGHILLLDAMG